MRLTAAAPSPWVFDYLSGKHIAERLVFLGGRRSGYRAYLIEIDELSFYSCIRMVEVRQCGDGVLV